MPNPHTEDSAYWDAALECYHQDRVIDAWNHLSPHGIGESGSQNRWYRLIEAEALLRESGVQHQITDWLTIETVPSETLFSEARIGGIAIRAAQYMESCFGMTDWPPVLISILCRESETAWATNPNGYWIPKEPYEKICLPLYLLDEDDELLRAIGHELSHVVASALSDDHAPTWLHEAISMFTEEVIAGPSNLSLEIPEWRSPQQLELLLDLENPTDPDKVFVGYVQSRWLGRYLNHLGGFDSVRKVLQLHTEESLTKNILRLVKGEDRIDRAIKETYSVSVDELFRSCRTWMHHTVP